MDHTEILGPTLDDIARQKAGIIKDNKPCVVGPNCDYEIIHKIAQAKNSKLVCVPKSERYETALYENYRIVEHAVNALKEIGALITDSALEGVNSTMPCRLSEFTVKDKHVVLDVGHNPTAILRLFQDLRFMYPNFKFIPLVAMTKGKLHRETLNVLVNLSDKVYITSTDQSKLLPYQELSKILQEISPSHLSVADDCDIILPYLLNNLRPDEILVICGSFYIMKKACSILNIEIAY